MNFQNTSGKEIHVNGQLVTPNTIFESDEDLQEIKNLIAHKYLLKIKE